MLDLKTVLIVTMATACLQALVWLFAWRAWRHLYELKFLAAGFVAIALGVLLMLVWGEQPSSWAVIIPNSVIKLGLVLLADGLARFLGQPRHTWVGVSMLLAHVSVWCAIMAVAPEDVALRIHASTVFTVVVMSLMCVGLMRDRSQPAVLRWITIAILVEYMLASVAQSILEIGLPAEVGRAPVLADRNAWYLLQGTLFMIALFTCLLFMVSSRLSADLRRKNSKLVHEVRERRRLEKRLNASLDSERALREEQGDLMRVVSHEFRTPLAIIRNAAEMIELIGEKSTAARNERLKAIHEALSRLFGLLDRFMADDRERAYRPKVISIGPVLTEVQRHFMMMGCEDRLKVSGENGEIAFFADEEMMVTVLINLIDNALKYSPDRCLVEVDVRTEDACLVVEVLDRGIGIPEGELEKIGSRFFRASNSKNVMGTGLGIYSARRFLKYHSGALSLQPRANGGTIAAIRIPVVARVERQSLSERVLA